MALFSVCGPIQFCRMAGDASHPARYAFIEFETAEAAAAAFRLNGTQVLDRQLKYVRAEGFVRGFHRSNS